MTCEKCLSFTIWCMSDYRRVLDWMNGFIVPYTFTTLDYRPYSTIAILHTLKFTVAHALGFSVFNILSLH
jgi:ABC-type uncharacterized transport system permease subunit